MNKEEQIIKIYFGDSEKRKELSHFSNNKISKFWGEGIKFEKIYSKITNEKPLIIFSIFGYSKWLPQLIIRKDLKIDIHIILYGRVLISYNGYRNHKLSIWNKIYYNQSMYK